MILYIELREIFTITRMLRLEESSTNDSLSSTPRKELTSSHNDKRISHPKPHDSIKLNKITVNKKSAPKSKQKSCDFKYVCFIFKKKLKLCFNALFIMHQYRDLHQPEKKRKKLSNSKMTTEQVDKRHQKQKTLTKMKLRKHSQPQSEILESHDSKHALKKHNTRQKVTATKTSTVTSSASHSNQAKVSSQRIS